ncbi:MAG: helix-turn-helix domain-containing protein [Cyclobacteriaceae bacterium]
MSANDIILVVVSGLGVIHGLFLAIFLWVYPKGNPLSNKLLSALLVALSFRVGKSVFLEYAENLDVKIIFIGLSAIMVIGPLFYLFTLSCTTKSFGLNKKHVFHFIPAIIGFAFGLWINEDHLETLPKLVFALIFIGYYLHLLIYLVISHKYGIAKKKNGLITAISDLLRLMFYGLLAIWVVYVLNLFDEFVPYVIGPILYSLVAYVVSFVVFRKGYIQKIGQTKYKTTPISDEQSEQLFSKALKLIVDNEQYKNPDLTLKSLSESLKVSPQIMSLVINQKSEKNFNNFINTYRIEESMRLFKLDQFKNHTVAAIAYEVGFNSISSFNTTFKKVTGNTPLAYRRQLTK